jgi:hypothetical protein
MTDPFGFVVGAVGLAVPLFQVAKKLRDQLKLVAHGFSRQIGPVIVPQAASERKKVLELIEEFEEEVAHLGDLYNTHKDVLDQQALTRDVDDLRQ